MTLRVLFDKNLYVSFLLSRRSASSVIGELFEHALIGRFRLVLPTAVHEELFRSLTEKPSLIGRVDLITARELVNSLVAIAEVPNHGAIDFVPVVRDPDDDVILAYAIEERVDYLVKGDEDLLALGDIFVPLKIQTPSAFLAELD